MEFLQNNLTPRETWVLALFLERRVDDPGKFYTPGSGFFLFKNRETPVKPECDSRHCWSIRTHKQHSPTTGCPTSYHRPRELTLTASAQLSVSSSVSEPSTERRSGQPPCWKCLKCKCARTPGQPPHPPGKASLQPGLEGNAN